MEAVVVEMVSVAVMKKGIWKKQISTNIVVDLGHIVKEVTKVVSSSIPMPTLRHPWEAPIREDQARNMERGVSNILVLFIFF